MGLLSPVARLLLAHGPPGLDEVLIFFAPVILAIKFVGYYPAARYLARRYPEVETSVPFLAAWRAITGLICGMAYYRLLGSPDWDPHAPIPMYMGLIPVRMIEWALIVFLFFGRHIGRKAIRRYSAHVVLGTLWSFALDVAIALVVVPTILLMSQRAL